MQSNQNEPKVLHVMITEAPPVGTWAFGQKGVCYTVIDRGLYYVLAVDADKPEPQKKRCLHKDACTVID